MPVSSQNIHHPLLRYLGRHNRRILVLLICSSSAVALLWGALFFGVYWLAFLAVTLGHGLDAAPPTGLGKPFIFGALLACSAAWFISKVFPRTQANDRVSPTERLWQLFTALPNATLGLIAIARGFHSLSRAEIAMAWELLQQMHKEHGMACTALPLSVPDPVLAERLVLNLQLVGLVELRRTSSGLELRLRGEEARAICQPLVRFSRIK